jgi:hypothetical protein
VDLRIRALRVQRFIPSRDRKKKCDYSWLKRPLTTIMLVSFLGSRLLRAEAVHVRDYGTHEPTDRHVLFAMAVTADQDVLSFVAKADGKWRLTRIHGWLEKRPTEQTIDIPGWRRKNLAPRVS